MHIHISSYHSDMKFDDYWNYFDLSPYKIITNVTGVTSGAGTAQPFGKPEFTIGF
jgi:hypothetical protein